MRKQILKVVTGTMRFHSSRRATTLCVCYVKDGIGYDAFLNEYDVVTDDYGSIVFVKTEYCPIRN